MVFLDATVLFHCYHFTYSEFAAASLSLEELQYFTWSFNVLFIFLKWLIVILCQNCVFACKCVCFCLTAKYFMNHCTDINETAKQPNPT